MTEQEYIDTTDLSKVRDVIKILSEITPTISSCIDPLSMDIVREELYQWTEQLSKKIKIQ
jgi:hypothetical protein